jgi:predicted PhzF superfamily epimerase YddE/YHI9
MHVQTLNCFGAQPGDGNPALVIENDGMDQAVRTAMKGQQLVLSREGNDYFVRLAPQPAPSIAIPDEHVAALLNAPGLVLRSAPQVASVGSPKLLVEVQDVDTLYGLAPDLAGIAAWGKQHGVSGCYVYCRVDDATLEGRNFNHLDPALEDSATGVAAGALAVALGRGLLLRQGRTSGRDCLIRARVEDGAVLVGGAAEAHNGYAVAAQKMLP